MITRFMLKVEEIVAQLVLSHFVVTQQQQQQQQQDKPVEARGSKNSFKPGGTPRMTSHE